MKRSNYFVAKLVACCLTLMACNKEPIVSDTHSPIQNPKLKINLLGDTEREGIAQTIAYSFGNDISVFRELNHAICRVVECGLDESVTFFDIFNTSNSVFLPEDFSIERLRRALSASNIVIDNELSDDDYYSNLQFYWPYHDDWDTTTLPAICFAPINKAAGNVKGFRYVNGHFISINITADLIDSASFPVVIIRQSETNYSDYPVFINNEWFKNGVLWAKPGLIDTSQFIPEYSEEEQLVYEARSVSITSSGTFYDYFWAGGNEIEVQSVYAIGENQLTVSTKARVEFTRKEIRNHATKSFGTQLHENWQHEFGAIYLRLTEVDDWGSLSPINVNLDVSGNTLSTIINVNSTDDIIFDAPLSRNNFFNRCFNYGGIIQLGTETLNCIIDTYPSY